MDSREFYIMHDSLRIHSKLDFPRPTSQEITCPAAELYPLVIIFHGFTGHMEERHIKAISCALNRHGFATLRVELYGHGQSDGDFRSHTLLKWLSQSLAVIDYAKHLDFVSHLYLLGHSQGGLLTILAGAMEADILTAIMPLSPAIPIPQWAREGQCLGMSFDPKHIPEELELKGGLKLSGNYLRTAQLIMVEAAIRRFNGPVLLVHGDADESIPYKCSAEAAQEYENARLVIISGDTHCYDRHLEMAVDGVVNFAVQIEEDSCHRR